MFISNYRLTLRADYESHIRNKDVLETELNLISDRRLRSQVIFMNHFVRPLKMTPFFSHVKS